ncbi:MAG TPA: arylamine N-acetyltransferase [Candidatus Binatus sp.]|nr:arylamine N-acetyltransferase [Candidatus Binatus sp.]
MLFPVALSLITSSDIESYLRRIRYRGSLRPSLRVLRDLHYQHLLMVPFENLDIHNGRMILLEEERFYRKIVAWRRGGYCYELNGLFALLLKRLGFNVFMLNARVASKNRFSPDYDHMTLLIRLNGRRWLVDVGFGDLFTRPLELDHAGQQYDNGRIYRVDKIAHRRLLSRWSETLQWEPQYSFTLKPHRLADFKRRNLYQQRSPRSHFRKGRLVSQLTHQGRMTLTDTKLIETRGSKRSERPVKSRREFDKLLLKRFHMRLSR